jgi:hypothetical protein
MAHELAVINSAYLAAQREVDAKLNYSNPNAMPIALAGIARMSEHLGTDASVSDIVDATFSGRLRGTVLKVLRKRGQL